MQVKVKVRPGRVVNGQKEGSILTVTPEQAEKLVRQSAVSKVVDKPLEPKAMPKV